MDYIYSFIIKLFFSFNLLKSTKKMDKECAYIDDFQYHGLLGYGGQARYIIFYCVVFTSVVKIKDYMLLKFILLVIQRQNHLKDKFSFCRSLIINI